MKYSFLVIALTLSARAWTISPPKNIISMDKATSIAIKTQSGNIQSKELEHENARWVYSFDIKSKDNVTHEVLVDAITGQIITQTIETPEQEQQELEHPEK